MHILSIKSDHILRVIDTGFFFNCPYIEHWCKVSFLVNLSQQYHWVDFPSTQKFLPPWGDIAPTENAYSKSLFTCSSLLLQLNAHLQMEVERLIVQDYAIEHQKSIVPASVDDFYHRSRRKPLK